MKTSGQYNRVPAATYRLQFNREFPFSAGRRLVAYLRELGVSDCYCSPIFTAPPESNHGYDVCDFTRINPALGGAPAWRELSDELRNHGMGLLLDFVPNHMGAIPQLNLWWTDVLEYGVESPYAEFFDIDWNPEQIAVKNKVLLPILPDHYGRVLEQGGIQLRYEGGRLQVMAGRTPLPLHPASCRSIWERALEGCEGPERVGISEMIKRLPAPGEAIRRDHIARSQRRLIKLEAEHPMRGLMERVLGGYNQADPRARRQLHELLEGQAYRLAHWKGGTRTVNYRRFFDVDSLVALKMERPEVFEATHELVLRLIQKGEVSGLRLDHIDGLANPAEYLERLQAAIAGGGKSTGAFYVLVEKITLEDETLPEWPVAGTTGYEFANAVTRLLLDEAGERELTRIYQTFTSTAGSVETAALEAKRSVMDLAMSKEIQGLAGLLRACAAERVETRDIVLDDLVRAIRETIARLRVYRTYRMPEQRVSRHDWAVITTAVTSAKHAHPEVEPGAWEFLMQLLLDDPVLQPPATDRERAFLRRFQQTTGAIMAKGSEDTLFYRYNRLNALNEVGGSPAATAMTGEAFHRANVARRKDSPHALLASSTHDTKVSEDVRARLAAISELAADWESFLRQAAEINRVFRTRVGNVLAPDRNEEYLLYQILLATWPLEAMSPGARADYITRLKAYMIKALNEAKINTRWDRRNAEWERAVTGFVDRLVASPNPKFETLFAGLAARLAELGALNSLAQTLLKLTVPGVPDFYQGNELWQFILVDPDNRRQIDFGLRQRMLREIQGKKPTELLAEWRTGGIKMFLTQKLLRFRRDHPALFAEGDYQPVTCTGSYADHCVAFSRTLGRERLVVLAPRAMGKVGFPPVAGRWKDTKAGLFVAPRAPLRDLFTGREFSGGSWLVSELLRDLPFAVLYEEGA